MSHFKFYSAHEGSIRHEYYAQDLPLFQEFLRLISQAYEDKYTTQHEGLIVELLSLMKNDRYEFRHLMSGRYYNYPILKWLEPDSFVKNILQIKCKNTMSVIDILNARYISSSERKIYLDEKEWFKRVIEVLENRLEG